MAATGEGAHPIAAAVAEVGSALDAALAASTVGVSQGGARELLVALEVQERRMHALRLRLVGESASHDGTMEPAAGRGSRTSTATWMRSVLLVTPARARGEVRAAELTEPDSGDLRELGAALAAGTTSAVHVQVACRAMTRIPRHLRVGQRERLSTALTEHATRWAPEAADLLAGHLLSVLDPDRSDRYDPAALERRSLHLAVDSTGMLVSRGQHDPVAGALLKNAIDVLASLDRHVSNPVTVDEGGRQATLGMRDTRSSSQRRVDALDDLVRAGVAHLATCDTAGGIGTAMSRLIVTATVDQLAAVAGAVPGTGTGTGTHTESETESHTDSDTGTGTAAVLRTRAPGSATCAGHGPVDAGFLQLAACDAVIDRVVLSRAGAVVSMTSQARYATAAMVRALIARDGGCAFPGCHAPPGQVDAHHVRWWSRGGPTEVANLVLLCGRHHRAIHAQEWEVEMRAGLPWFRPPHHLDPGRRWMRGTFVDAVHRARALAQHLTADEHRRVRWWERPAAA
jgi:hypothetical protein